MMINRPKNILLVDDDPDITNVIVNIFENTKWTFFQARNGNQAYDIACKERVDMVITDWNMPQCDGLELIQLLKENSQTLHIPIVILTGIMTDSEHLKKALELGATDFIRKPINEVELNARVISVLSLFDAHQQQLKVQQQLTEVKTQILQNELDYSKKMMSEKIRQQAQMSKKINHFIGVLNTLSEYCNGDGKLLLDKHVKELQFEKADNAEQEFFIYFEQQYPNFFKSLDACHPDLTEKEKKICALLVSDFNNRKIAQFFSNSESTIKTARKHLRRKLQISADVNLNNYLQQI